MTGNSAIAFRLLLSKTTQHCFIVHLVLFTIGCNVSNSYTTTCFWCNGI